VGARRSVSTYWQCDGPPARGLGTTLLVALHLFRYLFAPQEIPAQGNHRGSWHGACLSCRRTERVDHAEAHDHSDAHGAKCVLEGQLTYPWVAALQVHWRQTHRARQGRTGYAEDAINCLRTENGRHKNDAP
jgi:hypothetical protein